MALTRYLDVDQIGRVSKISIRILLDWPSIMEQTVWRDVNNCVSYIMFMNIPLITSRRAVLLLIKSIIPFVESSYIYHHRQIIYQILTEKNKNLAHN